MAADEQMTHPSFLFHKDDLGAEALGDDAMQGLIAMKYDPDDLIAQAKSYKEEGNSLLKSGKLDLAVDNYSAAIRLQAKDDELNSQLHFNRGIAHFKRGNYRTALGDFTEATKSKSDYFKAIFKAAECCLHLKRFDDCLYWCSKGLEIEPENRLVLEVQSKCHELREKSKIADQKLASAQKRAQMENDALLNALKSHGVRFHPSTVFSIDWFQARCPQRCIPKFAPDQSALCWPIILSYPELKKQDFIESFNEQLTMIEMLEMVTGSERSDLDPAYKPMTCSVYYEFTPKNKIVEADVAVPLLNTLRRRDFVVCDGTPTFIVLCKNNKEFCSEFIHLYDRTDLL